MNYNHEFHVGHYCDVLKHTVLIILLRYLQQKAKPLCYFETHAGYPSYDLTSPSAQKTREYEAGIAKLFQQTIQDKPLKDYIDCIKQFNQPNELKYYPGSTQLVANLLRSDDEIIIIDQHPDVYQTLKHFYRQTKNVHVHQRDGYEGLIALTPPRIKRGLVLIDPPYERADEYEQLWQTMQSVLKRFQNACYAIWFPIKADNRHEVFLSRMQSLGVPSYCLRYLQHPNDVAQRLNGTGMLILNPPYLIENELEQALAQIKMALL